MSGWKAPAKEFLSAFVPDLKDLYKKITGDNSQQTNEQMITLMLQKVKSPQDLLKKQEITVSTLRNYLQLDPKDTTYSGQELKNMVIEKWEILSSDSITTNSAPEDDSVLSPTQSRNKRSRDSVSATVSTKRKKEETPSTSQSRLILNNWWKVTNCVTETSTCSGTTDAGFVVTQPFPNRELATNSELPGEGNVIYILGNHASDGDQVEDNFGPWPAKMSGLNAVHLQFRSLMSESITEFSTRLGMNVAGSRLDHLSSSMLLFNTLKLLNAIEVRKALKKAVDGSPGCDATPFPVEIITRLENEFGVPNELIVAVDRVEQLKEQLNEACLEVHKILYLKDKKQVLQLAMNQRQDNEQSGNNQNLVNQIYRNRLRSLDACEKRAAKCREEIEIEKREIEAAKRNGLEAQRKQELQQDQAQLSTLETKISTRNRVLTRLQGNLQMIDQDIIQTRLQIIEVRSSMSASIWSTGSYDSHLKIEHDALSCSLAGLQETSQCLRDQIEVEEQSLQKEMKQLQALQSKINARK